jgi:hypothetical protein
MQNIDNFIQEINGEFKEVIGGSFIKLESGEIFTQAEVLKYVQKKLEIHNAKTLRENNELAEKIFGIDTTQRLVNKKFKEPKRNHSVTKATYLKDENSKFNIVHRERIEDVNSMKLDKNEKLVYYVIRDFAQHPSNCVMINNIVPTFKELEPLISLTERTIRDALKSLEDKNLLKLIQSGHRKAIYINPEYYATGKELNIDTLNLFNLLEVDDNKINSYLE